MSIQKIIDSGVRVSGTLMSRQDKIWSRHSCDKVDIGETLARILRTLNKALPLQRPLHALSIGSSNEPQFRILQTACQGGLYLLDIERQALAAVEERIRRQATHNVFTIRGDFNRIFSDADTARRFFDRDLRRCKMELIALQHSMYYCEEKHWDGLIQRLYENFLAPAGAIYCVLMSSKSEERSTTTWLYNHFAAKFCGHTNDQDLLRFARRLKINPRFQKAQLRSKTSRVRFFVDDFPGFMAVVWMILLYPHVHRYTLDQRREITEYIYKHFFEKKKPLIQCQDHLVIYRGVPFKGMV